MKAKKFIESKMEGEYELIKYHITTCDIDESELYEMAERLRCFDDVELAYENGVIFNMDDEIGFIEVDKFIKTIVDYLKDNDEDDDEDFVCELQTSLERYKGYTLYL